MEDAIAIIGMSCRFAGVNSPAALWNLVMSKRSALTSLESEVEMPIGAHNRFGGQYPSRIGQLGDLYSCVRSMHNFPRQINAGENQDLYFATQLAFDALRDAGLKPHEREQFNGGVRVGYSPPFSASTVNWLQHTTFLDQTLEVIKRFFPTASAELLGQVKEKLVLSLPEPSAASLLVGSGYRFASWIARECSFLGSASVMDSGILTGATVIADAMGELISGHTDIMIVGSLTPPLNRSYVEVLAGEIPFSSRNELHPFASNQDGTLPGEGGAFFVLKRRQDALRDHDRIYALIKSVEIGHNPEDDSSVILKNALDRVAIPASSVGLIEADGSGIGIAERREIEAIHKIWGEHRPGGPLVGIGSIKGNIGHTMRAAISAGVVKTALALYHRVLPPQVPAIHPIASIANRNSSAYLLVECRPWVIGNGKNPRRAIVLGANFDAVNPIGHTATAGRTAAIVMEEEPENRK